MYELFEVEGITFAKKMKDGNWNFWYTIWGGVVLVIFAAYLGGVFGPPLIY